MTAYTYMVECADGTLYTGWTTNIIRRVAVHNAHKGAKYTRVRTPVKLVYLEAQQDESSARKREYAIKRLRRDEKIRLVESQLNRQALELLIAVE